MEIKFCLGNITGRSKEVALKFDFDDKLVEQLKKVLNRYRYLFQKQTNMQAWQAGGWLVEKRVWYVRQELWDTVRNELIELGHSFVFMSSFEAKRYIEPEEQKQQEENKTEDSNKSQSESKQQENKDKKSKKAEEMLKLINAAYDRIKAVA